MFGWLAGVCLVYVAGPLEYIHAHYFIVSYPTPFVVAAIAVWEASRWLGKRGVLVALLIIAIVVAAYVETLVSFGRFVAIAGGTAGDYGAGFRFKADVVRFAVSNGLEIRNAPGPEYRQLHHDAVLFHALGNLDSGPPVALAPRREVDIYDVLENPAARRIVCPGRRDFGPLVACRVALTGGVNGR